MRRAIVTIGFALLLAGAARAEGPKPGEYLFVDIATKLPGWVIGAPIKAPNFELTQIVPPGQTEKDWTDAAAIETFYGPPKVSALDLLTQRISQVEKACEDYSVGPASPSYENGYNTAMRAVACTKSKQWGKGEVTLYKAWQGKDAMYLVARSWRGEPFKKGDHPVPTETTLKWLDFVQSIVLCDTRDPKRPCPNPSPQPAQPPGQPLKP